MQEERNTTQQEEAAPSTEKPKLQIEISRYKGILDMIADTRKLAKLILVMVVVVVLVFVGVTSVVLIVKKFYPYNTVNTNKYGATVIENENKDVIYWLFNSADLWANSGIEVKAGDVISVQTSGSFHTAIHHLVDEAKNNVTLSEPWMLPSGGVLDSPKNSARSEFRIAATDAPNVILMQVIPAGYENRYGNVKKWNRMLQEMDTNNYWTEMYIAGENADIYVIGTERRNIRIQTDGILHFAVNDIALTPGVIEKMERKMERKDDLGLKTGELKSYKDNKFIDAWFVDNVGSFLVAIEREKRR